MDLAAVVEGTGGMLGAHVYDAVSRTSVSDSSSAANAGIRPSAEDVYMPSDRTGEASPELPGAIRQQIDSRVASSCYCGHCSLCKAKDSESGSEKSGEESGGLRSEVASSAASEESEESGKVEEGGESEEARASDPELTDEEEQEVAELQQRDQEVRAHEQAHVAAGARNAQYDYQTGPDGRQYAVGGSADIEISAAAGDHDSKVSEARKMRAAALAPADPSAQDLAVAARATRIEMEALSEKTKAAREELQGEEGGESFAFTGGVYGQLNPFATAVEERYSAVA